MSNNPHLKNLNLMELFRLGGEINNEVWYRLDAKTPEERLEFTGAEIDTLVGLIEHGPLYAGDVPSKAGRDSLIAKGLAMPTIIKGEQGYTVATPAGQAAYRQYFCNPGGETAESMKEAYANRLTRRALTSLSHNSKS